MATKLCCNKWYATIIRNVFEIQDFLDWDNPIDERITSYAAMEFWDIHFESHLPSIITVVTIITVVVVTDLTSCVLIVQVMTERLVIGLSLTIFIEGITISQLIGQIIKIDK